MREAGQHYPSNRMGGSRRKHEPQYDPRPEDRRGGGERRDDLVSLDHAGLVHEEQLERAAAGVHLLLAGHPLHVGGEELHHVGDDLPGREPL